MTENKPSCYGHFPHKVPPMMEDCYKNCKGSIILCKKATHEREEAKPKMTLTDLEKKYYLCQPLTKKEWEALAKYWGSQLAELRAAIIQRYAILKEQNLCIDCFKDSPALATLVIQNNPKQEQKEEDDKK